MFLPRRMLPLLAALVASATAQNSTTVKLEGWYKCSEVTFESELPEDATASMLTGAECATFKAPLCHDGVCDDASNTQIDIFVKRISGTFAANRPNIFFMQGGPGAASPAMEDAMTSIYSILDGDVNVYTMDHRGTGRSTKLDCVAAQAQMTGGVAGSSVDATEVAACADELHAKYGSDLSSFSVTSAASDLKYFITNFLEGQTTFVYGVSYGSSLVERLIHLNTDGIAGYILDGISTTSGSDKKNFEYFSTWDVDYDEVGDYFLSKCAKNQAECGKYFPDASVAQTLRTLMSKLNSKEAKCTAPLDAILSNMYKYVPGTEGAPTPDVLLRSLFGSLLASSRSRKYIPVLTYRMNRCNDDDVKVINHFMNMYFGGASEFSEEDAFSSDLVYKLIVYSEFWETPTPSYETMLARFMNTTISSGSYSEVENYCVFTKEDSKACADYADAQKYDAKPIVYKKDKYWNVAAKPPKDVSVLLMSSKMDPQTPHKYAEYLYKALDTENKQLITFDQATHATLWTTPMSESSSAPTCGMQIVSSYIQEGGDLKKMDTSCVALMPSVSFTLSDSSIALLLNTTSPYDGVFTGTDVVPKAYTEPAKSNGSPSSSTNNSSGSDSSGKSYLGVFIAFAVAFAIAAIAAAVFVVKWRRAKKEGLQNANVYEASTV